MKAMMLRQMAADALEGAIHMWWHLLHPSACWQAAQERSAAQRAEAEEMARIRWAKAVQEAEEYTRGSWSSK